MIFVDNFVHGDLHPGNILVTPQNTLAFVDAGIVVSYEPSVHAHLIDVLSAFVRYDGHEGGRLMAAKSAKDATRQLESRGQTQTQARGQAQGLGQSQLETPAAVEAVHDLHGFCAKIHAMVEMARDEPSFFDKVGECIGLICEAACEHHVRMQSGFISIALSVKVVEGALLQVDPLCVVAPRAKAVIMREHLKRQMRGQPDHEAQAEQRRLDDELGQEEQTKRAEQRALLEARAAQRTNA